MFPPDRLADPTAKIVGVIETVIGEGVVAGAGLAIAAVMFNVPAGTNLPLYSTAYESELLLSVTLEAELANGHGVADEAPAGMYTRQLAPDASVSVTVTG